MWTRGLSIIVLVSLILSAGCSTKNVILKRESESIVLSGVTPDQEKEIVDLVKREFGADTAAKIMSIKYHEHNKQFTIIVEQTIGREEYEILGPRCSSSTRISQT